MRYVMVCVMASVTAIVAQPLETPRNLLRNTAFWRCTNPLVPDWWGTNAPEHLRRWEACLSVEDGSPIPGTRVVRLFNPEGGFRFTFQSFAHFLPSGKPYTFSVYLRAERDDFPVTLHIGYDQSKTVFVSPLWRRYTFTATPKKGHWAPGRLIVSLAFSEAGTLWVAAPQLEFGRKASDYTPLYAGDTFVLPNRPPFLALVERNFYIGDRFRVWCRNKIGRQIFVRCRVKDKNLPPLGDTSLRPDEQKFLSFSLADLSFGKHPLTIEAVTKDGILLASVSESLVRLPPPGKGRVVQIDRIRRHLLIDGKPALIFAQGLHANPKGWWWNDIARHGFNAVTLMIPTDPKTWATTRRHLDEAFQYRLWVIGWLRPPYQEPAPAIADAIRKTIQALRDHPAIIVWYLLDEPEGWWERTGHREEELQAIYSVAKAADPYRPAQLNWFRWTDGKGGYGSLEASDFGSLDHYPFGKVENPLMRVASFLWRMNRDCRPRFKPVVFWQQMYGYDDAVREPTPEEVRAHTWLTLITGGRLIYWFIYKPMNPLFWLTIPKVVGEMRRLGELLTAPDAFAWGVGREGPLHYTLWHANGADYLLVVNAGYLPLRAPVFARWLLPSPIEEAKGWLGDGSATVRDGVVYLWLPPLGAGVFRLR